MINMKMRKTRWIVKPAEKTPRRPIPLTLPDRLFPFPMYSSVMNYYRPKKGVNVDPSALRESLSKTLVHFYPMAGRYRLDANGIMEIDCNDYGVPFVVAETESDLEELGDFAPSPEISILLPVIDQTSQDLSSLPMLAVQVTYFKCGGISIGVRVEHNCVDGTSTFHLIKSWSEIARGLNISLPPFLDRTLHLCPRNPPQPKSDHHEYSLLGSTNQISHPSNQVVKISVFKLTKDQLSQLKAEHGDRYSTFEVLAGHIWKCVCKARKLNSKQETMLMFPVSARFNRWKPELPSGFFGNAILPALVVARAGELDSHAAAEIHKVSARMDSEYFRSAVDHLALLPDLSTARTGDHIFESPNFQITSWSKMGLNDADFGWGPPIYTGRGNIRYGKACIYPSGHSQGLSVAIALQPQHMKMFEKLFYAFENKLAKL